MVGLETLGCCKVEGTVRDGSVLVVGVTEDSVGLDIVDTERGAGISRGTCGGEGIGSDGDCVRDILGVAGVGVASLFGGSGKSRYDRDAVDAREGLYTDGGRGISSGRISSSSSSLSMSDDGIVGTMDGVLLLSASSSTSSSSVSSGSSSETSSSTSAGSSTFGQWHFAVW